MLHTVKKKERCHRGAITRLTSTPAQGRIICEHKEVAVRRQLVIAASAAAEGAASAAAVTAASN